MADTAWLRNISEGHSDAFERGRVFRMYQELAIPAPTNTTFVIKAVVPINVVLDKLEIVLDNGFVKLETVVGGVEGGTFTALTSVFPANTMSTRPTPLYVPQVALSAGGTLTGGTVIDIIRLKVENSSGAAASVSNIADARGVGANTYYFRFINLAASGLSEGTFKARWTELP